MVKLIEIWLITSKFPNKQLFVAGALVLKINELKFCCSASVSGSFSKSALKKLFKKAKSKNYNIE